MTCIPAKPSYLLTVTCIPVKTLLPGECDMTCIPAVTGYESAHCVAVFCISHSQCPLVCGRHSVFTYVLRVIISDVTERSESTNKGVDERMYLVFTRTPSESYRRRLRSLLLYLSYGL